MVAVTKSDHLDIKTYSEKEMRNLRDPVKREAYIQDLEDQKITRGQFKIKQHDIAIIGGGMAGSTCAKNLVEYGGQKVTVFDAMSTQETVGRAQSTVMGNKKTGKHIVEKGGELIDDSYSSMKGLARELNQPLHDKYLPGQKYCNFGFYVDGEHVSRQDLVKAIAPFVKMLARDYKILEKMENRPEKMTGTERQRYDHILKTFCSDYFREIKPELPAWAIKTLEAHIGGEWSKATETGAKTFIEAMGYEGFTEKNPNLGDLGFARYTLKNGTTAFMKEMHNRIMNNVYQDQGIGRIELGHVLKEVNLTSEGKFKLDFMVNGTPVTSYHDYIVLTAPPHVLKNVKFGPGILDASRFEQFKTVEFNPDGKVIVIVDGMSVGGVQSNSTTFRDNFGGSADEPNAGDNWTGRRNNIPQEGWDRRVQYIGDIGAAIDHFGGRRKLVEATRADMDKQFAGGDHHTGPAMVTEFNTNPYAKGAYAAWGPGTFEHGQETGGLAVYNRLDHPNVRMAGDSLSSSHNGYMEGAIRTGQLAADSIIGQIVLAEVEASKKKAFTSHHADAEGKPKHILG